MAHLTFIHGISAMPEKSELHFSWLKTLAENEGIDADAEGITANFVYWSDLMHPAASAVASSFESLRDETLESQFVEDSTNWQADLPANEQNFLRKLESKIDTQKAP